MTLPCAGSLTLHLQPDPSRAPVDLWDDLSAAMTRALLALAGLFIGSWFAIHHALRPLENVVAALDRTGQGNFDTRLPTDGQAELARLGQCLQRHGKTPQRNRQRKMCA